MALLQWVEHLGRSTAFALRAMPAAVRAVRRPRELARQLYSIYVGAFPLALTLGFALGVVIWMHLHGVIGRLWPGANKLLPEFLALAVVLEFAPLGAALIVAGRSGASLGAELGSLRLTEQMDALELMGESPLEYLVGPRVLACTLALPLLTVTTAALAIVGGFLAELVGGDMAWAEYANASLERLRLEDVIPAVLKTTIFGFLIGVSGCYSGMTAEGGTEAVGRAATRGVVAATFLVVLSNVVLVRLIQLVR